MSRPIRVEILQAGDDPMWDAFVRTHPDSSFFHQTSWKRVMEQTYGYQPYYFYAARGNQLTGIAPSFLVSSWISGKCLLSVPFAVYGGVCASDGESEQALREHLEDLAEKLRVDYLELRSRSGQLPQGYFPNTRYSTFTLPLVPDTEAMYASFPKDIRYMIRKGEKAGLRCVRGTDQVEALYRLMTINLRRLGTPAFPRALFDNLISQHGSQIDVTVLYSRNEPVAGGMSFFFKDTMQPYYIGSTDKAKVLAANNILWWELIKTAAKSGCRTFDFGRSKNGSGNFDFKKKWNPNVETLGYQVRLVKRKSLPNFSPTNPKFDLAMAMWKRVPLGLTRVLGPHLVRLFP